MKALTLMQPWATLMAVGAKRIETRSWPTAIRGEVAIHASKTFPRDAIEIARDDPFKTVLIEAGIRKLADLPLGAIVAVGDLVDCVPTANLVVDLDDDEFEFGNYAAGRYGFVFRGIRMLAHPVPAKGALGFWIVPEEIERLVWRELA